MTDDDLNGQIAALLAQSRSAHEQYRQAVRHHPPDVAAARAALESAAALRQQAHDLDVFQVHRAWSDEHLSTKFRHSDVMAFYAKELAKLNA